jgi:hypothetical protein
MNRRLSVALSAAALLALPVLAQQKDRTPPAGQPPQMSAEDQAMMEAFERMGRVGENHKLLESTVGEWSAKVKMWMKPGVPPMESAGSMVTRSVYGGRYYHGFYKGDMMGTPFEGAATTGYDNLTGKFWNTWADSMSTGLSSMTGSYDPASKSITFNGEWPDPMNPKTMTKVRQVFRIGEADRQVMEMYETRDGKEAQSMEIVYTRKK